MGDAIITGLIIASIAAGIIWLIIHLNKKEIAKLKQFADENYNRGKGEATKIIRETCDKIEDDKTKLEILTDRELLIETMLALGSYGRRIDGIETKLQVICNYEFFIDDINRRTQTLTQSFDILKENIASATESINSYQDNITSTSTNIQRLINDLGSLTDLHAKINNHVYSLNIAHQTMSKLKTEISNIVTDMDKVMTTCDQSPITKLKKIETDIDKLNDISQKIEEQTQNTFNTLVKPMSSNYYEKDSVLSVLRYIENNTDEISSHSDYFYRLRYLDEYISDVRNDINDLKSNIDKIQNDYYGNSIHSIKSDIEDLQSKLNAIQNDIGNLCYSISSLSSN